MSKDSNEIVHVEAIMCGKHRSHTRARVDAASARPTSTVRYVELCRGTLDPRKSGTLI